MNYKLKQKILATTSAVCLTAGITLPFFVNAYRPVPEKVSLQKGMISFHENSDVEVALERLKKEQSEKNIAQAVMKRPEFMASIKVDDTGIYYVVGNRAINILDYELKRISIIDAKGRLAYQYYFYAKDGKSCFDIWLNDKEPFHYGQSIDVLPIIMQLGNTKIQGEDFLDHIDGENLNLHRLMLYFDTMPYVKYVINRDKTELRQIFLSCGLSEEECSALESTIAKNGYMSDIMPIIQKFVMAKIAAMDHEISTMVSMQKFLRDFSLSIFDSKEYSFDASREANKMTEFIKSKLDQKYIGDENWDIVKRLKNRYGILYQAWLDGEVLRVSSIELNERENGLVRTKASYNMDEIYTVYGTGLAMWAYQPGYEFMDAGTSLKELLEIPFIRNKMLDGTNLCVDSYEWDYVMEELHSFYEDPSEYQITLKEDENGLYYSINAIDFLNTLASFSYSHLPELYVVQTEQNIYLLDTIPENGHIAARTYFDYYSLRLVRSEEDVYDVKTLADYMKDASLKFDAEGKCPLSDLGLDETKTYEGKYTLSLSNE